MPTHKILLVEDEAELAEVLQDNLEAEGYEVIHAADGGEGLSLWRSFRPDLVVLDIMMPVIDGLTLCRTMRDEGDLTPVLFLSARGQPTDRVQGLAAGGDDYMAKPFHLPEFLMRVHTMLRRQQWQQHSSDALSGQLELGPLRIDLQEGKIIGPDGQESFLSSKERQLLALFVAHEGEVLNRDFLLESLWSDGIYPSTRALERLVQRLRECIEPDPLHPVHIHRLSGVRFKFTTSPQGEDR